MPPDAPRPTPAALGTLITSSAALGALAVYQWLELLALRAGKVPSCALNATVNCGTVWSSPFASRVQDLLGMPVAALGVIYGVVGVLLSLAAWLRAAKPDGAQFLAAVKVWAAIGAVSCVTLGAASAQAGAVCLTCLGTYALTAVFAFAAFKLLPGPLLPDSAALVPAGGWALVLTVPIYLTMLVPGGRTPKADAAVETVKKEGVTSPAELQHFIDGLELRDKQALAWARQQWLSAPPLDNAAYPVRERRGPANAPVRIVDFTDIRCPHCRTFEEVTRQVERTSPEGAVSIEPRQFPLDGECNPKLAKGPPGDGVRCLAAQVQICLEGTPAFWDVRHELFEHQGSLTRDYVLSTAAAKSGRSPELLAACAQSDATRVKLEQDIEYAFRYGIDGTPVVLINDRLTPPAPVFVLALAVAKGDANASFFTSLPPPPAE